MSRRRKISTRKILQALLTVVLVAGFVFAVVSADRQQQLRDVESISVKVINDNIGFVSANEIKDKLKKKNNIDSVDKLEDINIRKLERMIVGDPWVENAQVYIDNAKQVHVQVKQKVPQVRIFDRDGSSYYLDRNLGTIPLSPKYVHYTTVFTNVPSLYGTDSMTRSIKGQILYLADYLKKDTFWNAQVSQVIVDDNLEFEIVPVLGEHRILLGDTSDMPQKLTNLLTFYKKVLNEVGWNSYEVLDVRYKGQLVASPGIDWNLPEDKVIQRINWVNSILGEQKKKTTVTNTMVIVKPINKTEDSNIQSKESAGTSDKDSSIVVPVVKEKVVQPRVVNEDAIEEVDGKKVVKQKKEIETPKYLYAGDGN